MRYIAYSAILFTTFLVPCAFAETKYSAYHHACISKARDDVSIRDCNGEELAKQSARLNEAYKFAIAALPDEKKEKLKIDQALWLKFRNADCELYYSLTGGTIDLLNGSGCELSMTRDRADSLEWFADNGGEYGGE